MLAAGRITSPIKRNREESCKIAVGVRIHNVTEDGYCAFASCFAQHHDPLSSSPLTVFPFSSSLGSFLLVVLSSSVVAYSTDSELIIP